MAEPVVFLATAASDGITGQRVAATEFASWRAQVQPWRPGLRSPDFRR